MGLTPGVEAEAAARGRLVRIVATVVIAAAALTLLALGITDHDVLIGSSDVMGVGVVLVFVSIALASMGREDQ